MPVPAHQGHGALPQVVLAEEAEGEFLLPGVLGGQPGVGHAPQLGQQPGHGLARGDLEGAALLLDHVARVAQALARLPRQGEVGQRHAGLLADLDEREAQVQVQRQVHPVGLVEHGPPGVEVHHLAEAPGQLAAGGRRPHGVAHGDPALARHAVHQEPVIVTAHQEVLVAQQRQVRGGLRRGGHDGAHGLHVALAGRRAARPGRAHEPEARQEQPGHEDAHRGAQEAAGVGLQGEHPPQLAVQGGIAVGHVAQQHGAAQYHQDGRGPAPGEALRQERGLAVEELVAGQQRQQEHREEEGLLVVQALEQAGDDAREEYARGDVVGGVEPFVQAAGQDEQAQARQAAHEVREFQNPQGQHLLQPVQARMHGRGGAGEEQHRAGQEGQHGQHARGHLREPLHEHGDDVARGLARGQGLAHGQDGRGQGQGG